MGVLWDFFEGLQKTGELKCIEKSDKNKIQVYIFS